MTAEPAAAADALAVAQGTSVTVQGVSKEFVLRRGVGGRGRRVVRAVLDVSLDIPAGKTVGVVGDSGSGKSTLGRMIVGLEEPTAGRILIDGADLARLGRAELATLRPKVQMVFQDSHSSLDPRLTIEAAVCEPLIANRIVSRRQVIPRAAELLRHCGLGEEYLQRYPHELSGGQRQRVGIARALATGPEVLVLDEPTSALDVSVQAQVLNLLKDLQDELHLTYVFISHDLAVVRSMSDEVAVMSQGRLVEHGAAEQVFRQPAEPYTQRLLAAVPGYPGASSGAAREGSNR